MTWAGFGLFDVAAAAVIVMLAVYGALRGAARLALEVAGLAVAWLLALRYCDAVARRLGAPADPQASGPDLHRLAAFALIVAAVMLVVAVLAWGLTRLLRAAKLGTANRLAGMGLGVLAAILIACAASVPLVGLCPPDGGPAMKGSRLAPYAVAGGEYLNHVAPEPIRSRFTRTSRALFAAAFSGDAQRKAPAPDVSEPKPAPSRRPR